MDIKENSGCSPISSLYCNLKIRLTGNLNDKNLNDLYKCSLCNECHLASFNHDTREKAVSKSFITSHIVGIKNNIMRSGNSYGVSVKNNCNEQAKMETILFRGCTPTHKTPEILESAENLLKIKDINYSILNNETCCGNILFNLGDIESGNEVVKSNIEKFKATGVKRIITICPGCYNAFNKYYKGHYGFNPEIILAIDLLNDSIINGKEYVIQDPCHAKEKSHNVRKIISGAGNKSASHCCGAGAGVMAHDNNVSSSKARKTVNGNSENIVTYCPFCYLNLSSVNSDKVSDIYMLLAETA
ncbi:(Fe-S)-binding protein [Methanobacterium oryzae]|uniref:(Fe-S)-binding protein n=1 Tax=Methanobacterium oryzae TaxID=69540 RepID=UPI003D1ABEF0